MGGRGAICYEVLEGETHLNIFWNSLCKSQYIITLKADLRHVIRFTNDFLEPEDGEEFRSRQV